ncbi:MAG: ribonuclease N, partial [Gibbsiella quercinecans]
MNKRILVAMAIAVVIAGFSALRAPQQPAPANVPATAAESIDRLTQQARVVSYLKQRQRLPDYYISKKQAREQGWDARDGN